MRQCNAEEYYHLVGFKLYANTYVPASTLPSMHAMTTELYRLSFFRGPRLESFVRNVLLSRQTIVSRCCCGSSCALLFVPSDNTVVRTVTRRCCLERRHRPEEKHFTRTNHRCSFTRVWCHRRWSFSYALKSPSSSAAASPTEFDKQESTHQQQLA